MTSFEARKALYEAAQRIVEQWDNHDKFRETEADKAFNDPLIGEPTDVAMAREYVKMAEKWVTGR